MRHVGGTRTKAQSEESIARFVRHWEEHGFGMWEVEEGMGCAFIGFVGLLHNDDWTEGEHKVEVGRRLDWRSWGRGFATEGAQASLRYGFEEQGLERIISVTVPQNVASWSVMEKIGLAYEGGTH
jgi:RimJ/RimL family protein N-acetyltransferase